MSKKSHHFLTLWPWPLTYDLEKLIRSGHYHYQCVYQILEQSIPWFLSYRVNTIAGGGRRVAGDGRLWRKTITSPDPSDTGDIMNIVNMVTPVSITVGRHHNEHQCRIPIAEISHEQQLYSSQVPFNTLKLAENDSHVTDNIFRYIFLYENCTYIQISLNFVSNGHLQSTIILHLISDGLARLRRKVITLTIADPGHLSVAPFTNMV